MTVNMVLMTTREVVTYVGSVDYGKKVTTSTKVLAIGDTKEVSDKIARTTAMACGLECTAIENVYSRIDYTFDPCGRPVELFTGITSREVTDGTLLSSIPWNSEE